MKELLALLLPPATALVGMRIARLLLGAKLEVEFKFGLRFALGMCVGMLVFTQGILLGAVVGLGLCAFLAWTIFTWATVEAVLLVPQIITGLKQMRFQPSHLWLIMLAPVVLLLWEFGRLNLVDGVREFDAAAFWLLKARILYFDQGKAFLNLLHTSNLAYTHMDYPWLVPGLYGLTYGALGGVDEFVVKIWPLWMVLALCGAIFSIGQVWRRPHPAPILMIVLFCYLPATERFLGQEGATMPLLFGVSISALLLVFSLVRRSPHALAAGLLALGCCAATKLEGLLYSMLWVLPLSLYCWRSRWLKNPLILKSILFAACLLLPYAFTRLQKPVLYPEAYWLRDAAATPASVLHRYPQALFLAIGHRFFNPLFFNWDSPDKDHLHFIGQWQGRDTFSGPELSVMPWVLLILLGLTLWKKPAQRLALGALLTVIIGQFFALSLIISCLRPMQADLNQVIDFTSEIVGRYFYPFFTACFLGTLALWLLDNDSSPVTSQGMMAFNRSAVESVAAVDDITASSSPRLR